MTSYGGSTKAGNSIISLIDRYKAKSGVKCHVEISYAASMATGFVAVGDTVSIHDNAMFMVHKPLCMSYGNANDLQKSIEMLDMAENALIANYMRRFKGTEDELRAMLEAETWLSPEEVVKWGFADEIIEDTVKAVACENGILINNVLIGRENAVKKYKETHNYVEEDGEKEMKYSEILREKYGITEDDFDSMTTEQILDIIENKAKEGLTEIEEGDMVIHEADLQEGVLDGVAVEDIISLATQAKNTPFVDDKALDKAKQFDKIYAKKVSDTLAMGLKAFGAEDYDEKPDKKTFDILQDYDHVCAMFTKYEKQAQAMLNAGNRASAVTSMISVTKTGKIEKIETNF